MPWPDAHFDLVISINTLHNFYNYELDASLREIERVAAAPNISASRPIATSGRR
jgi:ubiquinone/menaquinone biosynthesis C-methylase UbiE